MIAVDTSTFVAYFGGDGAADTEATDRALADQQVVLPPAVLCELLSDPRLRAGVRSLLLSLPLLAVTDGYWERAGLLRARVLASGRKAPLADALIAQSCIDHGVVLISRDADFRHFARHGLSLFG